MASKVIKIKIGTDVHQMVDNKGEKIGCYECSLFNMCSRLGNSQTPLCDSLIKENASPLDVSGKEIPSILRTGRS